MTDNHSDHDAADLASILSSLALNLGESSNEHCYYSMPAEWEEHSACLILFPHNPNTFRVKKASKEIADLALAIATTGQESVYFLCKDTQSAKEASEAIAWSLSEKKQDPISLPVSPLEASVADGLPIFTAVCPSNDTWARDTCPTFVFRTQKPPNAISAESRKQLQKDKLLIGLDWDFNAYGGPEEGCYWPCTDDRKIAGLVCSKKSQAESVLPKTKLNSTGSIARSLSIHSSLSIPMILEGGSFHTDGEGTLLTTSECLLNPNRNPHLTKDQIESVLKVSLGIQKVLWLPYGLDADLDTNGHVDNFCCFVKPGHVVLAWTNCKNDDESDDDDENEVSNYQRCRAAHEYLQSTTDARGRRIEITRLYLPNEPLRYTREEALSIGRNQESPSNNEQMTDFLRYPEERMAASYINFYIANKAVLVPQFASSNGNDGDLETTDKKALEILRPLFPGRSVVGISSREILLGGGNIHCQTQQVPSI